MSACLIVRNEEEHLPRCLTSLQGLADEIVVIDTGSTDRTVEIAESFGARVWHEPWQNDFSLHRNQSLDRATGKWLLVIDADEELVDTDVEETRWHLDGRVETPVVMVHEHLLLLNGRRQTVVLPRIIRADTGIRYQFPVHEQLVAAEDLDGAHSNVQLLHHGYVSLEALERKQARNLELARTLGDDPHGLHTQARAMMTLCHSDGVVETCRRLLTLECGPVLALEACALGGAVALKLNDDALLEEFVAAGRAVRAESPDVALLDFLAAGKRYARVLEENGLGTDQPSEYLRPLAFKHSLRPVQRLVAAYSGWGSENGSKEQRTIEKQQVNHVEE